MYKILAGVKPKNKIQTAFIFMPDQLFFYFSNWIHDQRHTQVKVCDLQYVECVFPAPPPKNCNLILPSRQTNRQTNPNAR